MYKKVNNVKLSETHLRTLSLFTRGFDRSYYIREVETLLNVSPRTAQLALDFLEKKTVLESESRGKIRTYRLKKSPLTREYLLLAETYKKIIFLEQHMLIKEVVEKTLPHTQGVVAVFGSYAKGTQKEDSDLDLFIVGTYDSEKIRELSELYQVGISIKNYPAAFFEKEASPDILIKEVLSSHILLKGFEEFLTKVISWTK